MLLASVVAASDDAAATRSRTAKVAALATALRAADATEVAAVVGFLTGWPRQGRVGVGWGALRAVRVPDAATATVTVGDLDTTLTAVMNASGSGSQARRRHLLEGLLARCTAAEQGFVVRLLLGELRQGALEGLMAEAVAKAADVGVDAVRRAAMLTGDLGVTAELALHRGGAAALAGVSLQVQRPVQPMLAATSADVAEAVTATGEASVEWKLDGARVQVHRSGDHVAVFTRNLHDVTSRLPGVVAVARALPVTSVVLDGEVLGLRDDDEGPRPRRFQDTMAGFGSDAGDAALRPWFFDVLHADGTHLLDAPLRERLAVLDTVAGVHAVPRLVTADPVAATTFADEALAAGHEGVMVKALESPYEAGRRGASWRKVKPVRTLDLVVVAVEWGSGRRQGLLSNLHLAAPDPAAPGTYVMVGKTFKGLTDELLAWQTRELLARELGREGHVVHVRPELVVEIALDGVLASSRYPGGVALRFARVRRYRPDKRPEQADPITAVQALLR